jgi:hypothetical protein
VFGSTFIREDLNYIKGVSNMKLKSISLLTIFLCAFFVGSTYAQEVKVGGHVGALGVGSETGIGFGGALQIAPYETVGIRLDATFAQINGSNYFATTPMVIWFVPTTEEFKAGLMLGAGFHKIGNLGMKFGMGGGASADFVLSKNMSIGGVVLLHNVFDFDSNVWSTMLTFNFAFGDAGSWDW